MEFDVKTADIGYFKELCERLPRGLADDRFELLYAVQELIRRLQLAEKKRDELKVLTDTQIYIPLDKLNKELKIIRKNLLKTKSNKNFMIRQWVDEGKENMLFTIQDIIEEIKDGAI